MGEGGGEIRNLKSEILNKILNWNVSNRVFLDSAPMT